MSEYDKCESNLISEPQVIINRYRVIVAKKKLLNSNRALLLQDCKNLLSDIKDILSDENFKNSKIIKISEEIVDFIDLLLEDFSFENHQIEVKDKTNLLDNFIIPKNFFKV
jgi:hypothetical protein